MGQHEDRRRDDRADHQRDSGVGEPRTGGPGDEATGAVLLAGRLQWCGEQDDRQESRRLGREGAARRLREDKDRQADVDQPDRHDDQRHATQQIPPQVAADRVQPADGLPVEPPLQQHRQRDQHRGTEVDGQEQGGVMIRRPCISDSSSIRPVARSKLMAANPSREADHEVADRQQDDRHHALPPAIPSGPEELHVLGARQRASDPVVVVVDRRRRAGVAGRG